ncbi:MAG: single-stranded-DNA-specific exonuclease RecJ [Phycisphaerae bacterium]
MSREWFIYPPHEQTDSLSAQLGISRLAAQMLLNRGISEPGDATRFIDPRLSDLHPPEAIHGLTDAADRIVRAVRDQRKIVLYGDYDVDGITGVAILWHCLVLAGAQPDYYVPHRLEEGYGLNTAAIESLAADGAAMIISVDCGITAVEQAAAARRLGVELIITDHHKPRTDDNGVVQLPDAAVVVHPGLGAQPVNPDLSGSGVALKLAWGVAQRLSNARRVSPEFREFLITATGLAALGLVADVVPLTGENRILALHGLRGLPHSKHPGIAALISSAGLTGQNLSAYDVGFRLGPRLNAIGRMGHARLAVELLTRAAPDEAARIAQNLEQHNRSRQTLERRILAGARDMVRERGLDGDGTRAIVLAAEGWHAGVIGIVASRLVDEFHRPTVLIALANGDGQGSARSIRHFPLHDVLRECRDHLEAFGGHAMAAGLRLRQDQVEGFTEAFQQRAAQRLTAADLLPTLKLDAVADLPELVESLMRELAALEPHGAGNPGPRLATPWLNLVGEPRVVGARGDHLQVTFEQNGAQRKAIAFGMAGQRDALCDARRCRVAFRPILNEWNGRRSVEMQVIDFKFPD